MKRPSLKFEKELIAAGFLQVAGVDEVGRGPLAGPVCAAAVILPAKFRHKTLNDSKVLREEQREEIYEELTRNPAVVWRAVLIEVEVIDRINILRASHQAMFEAVLSLGTRPDAALVDGLPVPGFPVHHRAIVGGDGISLSIAAASVIAKVTRDRLMKHLASLYPHYGFEQHKGYATRDHLSALRQHGPCPIHRRSFEPVAQMQLPLD